MLSIKFDKIALGFILATVSTLVSSITTIKNQQTNLQQNSRNNGTLLQYSGGDNYHQPVLSCRMGAFVPRCHFTEITATTGDEMLGTILFDADGHFYDTEGNTSISYPDIQIDTTSFLVQYL